jgi:hypothetical protein
LITRVDVVIPGVFVPPQPHCEVRSGLVEEAGGERYTDVVAPAWTTYAGEARRIIAAARAMGLVK